MTIKINLVGWSMALVWGWCGMSVAASLPATFTAEARFDFSSQDSGSIGRGIPSIEIGPDRKLWLFEPPVHQQGKVLPRPGEIQTLDAVNDVFFAPGGQLSTRFGSSENGAVFTRDGKLLSFKTGLTTATLRDSIDEKFFNEDDVVSSFPWPFGILLTVGQSEPSPAAFGPKGKLFITVPQENKLLVYDPMDGDLTRQKHDLSVVKLSSTIFGRHPMGITFDREGHLYLSSRDVSVGKDTQGQDLLHDVLIGIDSVDGIFFNTDDVMKVYDLNVILSATDQPLENVLVTDLVFDLHGHLILFDAKAEILHRLKPEAGFFDKFGIKLPRLVRLPTDAITIEDHQ